MLYLQDRLTQELLFFNPYGWLNQASQILKSPAAGWGTIQDLTMFLMYAFAYPLQDDEEAYYQRGEYAGESKAKIKGMKLFPFTKQYLKMERIEHNPNYYKLFDPKVFN